MRADRTTSRRARVPRRSLVVVALALVASMGLAGCGDDVPSKEEFTSKIGTVTGGKVDPELAGCVYQKLGKTDGDLLSKASQTPNLTKHEDELLSVALSHCIIDKYEKDHPKEATTTTTTEDRG